MPGETHFFDYVYADRGTLGSLSQVSTRDIILRRLATIYDKYYEPLDQKRIDSIFRDPALLIDFHHKCKTYKAVYSWFMEIQMHYENKLRWGNQVPRDIFNIKEILQFYPDAKFIVCVRDIRDFILSYRNKWRKVPARYWDRMKNIYHPVVTSSLWKASVNHIQTLIQLVPPNIRVLIKYENLVNDEIIFSFGAS